MKIVLDAVVVYIKTTDTVKSLRGWLTKSKRVKVRVEIADKLAWEFLKTKHCFVNRKSCKVPVKINQEISVQHAIKCAPSVGISKHFRKASNNPLHDLFDSVE